VFRRFSNYARLLESARRAPMQLGHERWVLLPKPVPQQVGEQVMVAIPAALIIEWDEDQILLVETGDDRRSGQLGRLRSRVAADDRLAQLGTHSLENRGLEQKRADVVALAAQHLFGKGVSETSI
jgi:hypothetical protein